jgi:hypothetical protein
VCLVRRTATELKKKNLWLGFRDTFRTLCIAPPKEIRVMFEVLQPSYFEDK